MEPKLYSYQSNSDHRGSVSFVNNLNLEKIVRTYRVINKQIKTVRAWHGHKIEEKWISVEEGEFLVCAVKIDNFNNPNKDLEIYKYKITSKDGILYIPNNFVNGAMNLTESNSIRYYSSLTLDESVKDDFRFDSKYWDPWSKYNPNLYE